MPLCRQSLVDIIRIKTCICKLSIHFVYGVLVDCQLDWIGLDWIRLDWTGQLADCKLQLGVGRLI